MNKKLKKLLLLTTTTAMAFTATGCSTLGATDSERAQKVIETYQAGEAEKFKSYVGTDNSMTYIMDALDDENAEGMTAVYQKVYELTKTAEFTFAEESKGESDDGYATVTIKTVDFSNALDEAMAEAIAEGGEAFADVPTWMMKALETGGESVEKEVQIRTKSNNSLYEGFNDEFLEALTGGFYDYILSTMTTCTSSEEDSETTYMLAANDIVHVSLDDYVVSSEGAEVTDEQVNEVISNFESEYGGYDGIEVNGNRVDNGVRLYMVIDYDVASMYTLQRLGLTTSGGSDKIGLSVSIEGLESDGYTCETTDFGSGAASE